MMNGKLMIRKLKKFSNQQHDIIYLDVMAIIFKERRTEYGKSIMKMIMLSIQVFIIKFLDFYNCGKMGKNMNYGKNIMKMDR